jgi:hypothetical protein
VQINRHAEEDSGTGLIGRTTIAMMLPRGTSHGLLRASFDEAPGSTAHVPASRAVELRDVR